MASSRNAADRYERIEQDFRALLWRQFPGATTNQVHRTAARFTAMVKQENDEYAAELARRHTETPREDGRQ